MNQYDIDRAIESVMDDMDMYDQSYNYDYDDYATESLDRVAVNTAMTVGLLINPVRGILAQLAHVPIAMLSAANIRAITKDAIRDGDPEQIKNAIKVIKARVRHYDNTTAFDKLYTMGRIIGAGTNFHAEQVMDAANECLPKLERAFKECRNRKPKYTSNDIWEY